MNILLLFIVVISAAILIPYVGIIFAAVFENSHPIKKPFHFIQKEKIKFLEEERTEILMKIYEVPTIDETAIDLVDRLEWIDDNLEKLKQLK
jgi:hypothetical protein